ncbi:MAG: hypothetical protein L0206_16885, partial [Actinobacteria bacterium]|nr:hypothetical protein [Actinomycetota bacterium]
DLPYLRHANRFLGLVARETEDGLEIGIMESSDGRMAVVQPIARVRGGVATRIPDPAALVTVHNSSIRALA